METTIQRSTVGYPQSTVTIVRILTIVGGLLFLVWGSLHLGVTIPLGFMTLAEPVSIPAFVVESLCGLALFVGAYGLLARKSWAWRALFGAHIFAFLGVMLGMFALALVPGPRSLSNDLYHNVALIQLVTNLILLQRPGVRVAIEES